jgi:hypothetical protein
MTGNSVNVGPASMLHTCRERDISGRDVASNIKDTWVESFILVHGCVIFVFFFLIVVFFFIKMKWIGL